MLNMSQAAALLVGMVVFLAVIVPGYTRYALFGVTAIVAVNTVLFGAIDGLLPYFLR